MSSRSRAAAGILLLAGAFALLFPSCDKSDGLPPPEKPRGDLPFAFVDVAGRIGYTMRNRSGTVGLKEFIHEAMPPGVAAADLDGDGFVDMYCPNGNSIAGYDPKSKTVTFLDSAKAPRNELYWNDGGKRFVRGAKDAGVDDQLWGYGSIAGDVDNDGDKDLYVCNWGPNRLYLNQGSRKFQDVAARVGVAGDPQKWSTGACFVDYDRDGDLDLYVAQYADMFHFFEDKRHVSVDKDGRLRGRSCEWKRLKVYCGPLGLKPDNDILYQNLLMETGELRFTDVTRAMGMEFKYDRNSGEESSAGPFYGFVPVAWDIDGDGWQDILVANDSVANTCWINQEGKGFVDRASEMGLEQSLDDFKPQASMGIGVGDLNLDGVFDVAMSEFSHDQFNLLTGERLPNGFTVFNEKASKTTLRKLTFLKLGWGTNLIDVDLDGDQDIFFACGHVYPEVDQFKDAQETTYRQRNLLILNEDPQRLRLRDVSGDAGPGLQVYKASRASVALDFDNDGDLDIATTELNDSPCLLRCDIDRSKGPRHWLMVDLEGNPRKKVPLDPAGAVVKVSAGDLRMMRVLLLGSSFQSSEDPRLHFGLGPHEKAAVVEVFWPNGDRTRLENVDADQILRIKLK